MNRRTRTLPRKTPQQDRARATVDAILSAAAQVLCRVGYDGASTNQIARAAGVSIGSLYQYYPSKDALVSAVTARLAQQMIAVLEQGMMPLIAAPLPVAARGLVDLVLTAHNVDLPLYRALLECAPTRKRLSEVATFERHVAQLTRVYLEARRAEIRPVNIELAVFVLIHSVQGLTRAVVLDHPEYLSSAELAEELTQLVLRFLGGS